MISPRRQAQFGLLAATVVFLSSVSIIVTGALSQPRHPVRPGLTASIAPPTPMVLGDFNK